MLRAVGFKDADFRKPIIGIANGYSTIVPCNVGLNDLTRRAGAAARKAGAMIALIVDGDSITIDAGRRLLQVNIPEAELERRRAAWRTRSTRYRHGVMAKYAAQVSSAARGAVTD